VTHSPNPFVWPTRFHVGHTPETPPNPSTFARAWLLAAALLVASGGLAPRRYLVALCNFYGSVTFLIAPIFYYLVEAAKDDEAEAAYLTTWGLKFMYLVGSIAFAVGAACGVVEVMQDS